jgi:HAE1 family hydrophobic/amphiphilic exporter-1
VFFRNPPPINIGGFQSRAEFQFTLQDADVDALYRGAVALEARMRAIPALRDVTSDLRLASPRVSVDIDRDRAAALGVSPLAIEDALYAAYGDRQVSTIFAPEDQYQVILSLLPEFKLDPAALAMLYVRSSAGKLVPLDAVASLGRAVGPQTVNHAGQLPSVTLSFNLVPGKSLGDAVGEVERAAAETLAPTVSTRFQGTAQAFESSKRGWACSSSWRCSSSTSCSGSCTRASSTRSRSSPPCPSPASAPSSRSSSSAPSSRSTRSSASSCSWGS